MSGNVKSRLLWVACCLLLAGTTPTLAGVQEAEDDWLARPVDDTTYRGYLDFFEYDTDLPLDIVTTGSETADGVTRERVSFASTPGQRVTAILVREAGTDAAGSPAVVLTHGGGGAGKDGPGTQVYATLLARAGWVVLAIDMWHYGERDDGLMGDYTQETRNERLYSNHSNYLEFITQTVKDVGRSIDFLVDERNADPNRIVYVGLSRGAVVGIIVGAAETRLAGAALVFAGHRLSWAQSHVAAACPANYIGRISPRPLLMVNGTNDTYFPAETTVQPLQALAGEPNDFRWLPTGHSGIGTPLAQAAVLEWLQNNFPH